MPAYRIQGLVSSTGTMVRNDLRSSSASEIPRLWHVKLEQRNLTGRAGHELRRHRQRGYHRIPAADPGRRYEEAIVYEQEARSMDVSQVQR